MKRLSKLLSIMIMMMFIFSAVSFAGQRVICEVKFNGDSRAEITINWADGTGQPLRIVSWGKEADNLVIYYDYGAHIPVGWNSRVVEGINYNFPSKVILKEQGNERPIFKDMPTDQETADSLLNLYYRNIISGYPDGTFKEDNKVTRAEFAKMITSSAKYSINMNSTTVFKDVSSGFWGKPYIGTLVDKGILNGYPDQTFKPNGQITIGEVLAVINRTFVFYEGGQGYNYPLTGHWSDGDFHLLVKNNMVKSWDSYYYPYTPNQKATRGDCAILLSRALEKVHTVK